MPLVEVIRAHVLAAERIHADDTTVPLLAKGRCRTGRLWAYVRDDRPFAGTAAPAAAFFYSADRGAIHPDAHLATYAGLMQADAYAGFNRLYEASRKPGPIDEAMCWAHARRKFFDLARLSKAPIAIEAVERIDALFAIERDINGKPPPERARVRNEHSRPIVTELETWLRKQRAKLSAKNEVAKAITYSLNQWRGLVRFLDDGRLCMSNNAAERALRCVAVGRHNWTFAGSEILRFAVMQRRNVLVAGGTSTGKTTLVDLPAPDTPMITKIGGLPRCARALSRRRTPAASATKTGSARPMKRPLSTTPTTRRMRSSIRAGSTMGSKLQSRMRFPLSVIKGSPDDDSRRPTLAPSTSRDVWVTSSPKGTTSTGTGAFIANRSTSLPASTTMARRWLAAATIFSRSNAPPDPLIRFSVPRSTSSAPSIVRSICRCSLNEVSGISTAVA
jgi:hypothetical protein